MPKGKGGLGSRRGTGSATFGGEGAQNDFQYGGDGALRWPSGVGLYFVSVDPDNTLGLPGDWAYVSTANCFSIWIKEPNNTWLRVFNQCF